MWKKMYLLLSNAVVDALQLLDERNVWDAKKVLMNAQSEAEEMFLSAKDDSEDNDNEIKLLPWKEKHEKNKE